MGTLASLVSVHLAGEGKDEIVLATLMGMERVCGEDALPRLGQGLDRENLRQWMTARKPNSTRRYRIASLPTGMRR